MQLKRNVLLILMIILFVYFEIHSCAEDGPVAPEQGSVPADNLVYKAMDVCFIDSERGWIAGCEGTVASTADGGETWAGQQVDSCDFRDVLFVGPDKGWLAGRSGALYCTVDGGEQWQKVVSGGYPVDEDFSQLQFHGESIGFLQGFLGVYRTEDGGADWNNYWLPFVPYKGAWGMSFVDEQTGYLLGTRYMEADPILLYTTVDGGLTWTGVNEARSTVLRGVITIAFVDRNTGWAGGSVIMKTVDGGRTWELQRESAVVRKFWFFSDRVGYAIGGTDILRTSDGGATWIDVAPVDGRIVDLRGCCFIDESTGWVVGIGGEAVVEGRVIRSSVIIATRDGGAVWSITEMGFDCTDMLSILENAYF